MIITMPDLFTAIRSTTKTDWTPPTPPELSLYHDLRFDVETTGLKWWAGDRPVGIAIMTPDEKKWYLPFGHLGGGNLDESVVKRWAQRELRGKRLTAANSKFDVHQMREWGVDLEAQGNEISDVQHYAALLDDHRKRFNLETLGQELLGEGKIKGLEKDRISEYHAGEVAPYAEQDVTLVHKLIKLMWPQMEAQDLHRVRALEDQLIYATCEMEKNAAYINVNKLEQWRDACRKQMQDLCFEIYQDTGLNTNPKSPDDLKKIFRNRNVPLPIEETDGGDVSFSRAALKDIEDPVIKKAYRFRQLKDLDGKYLTGYLNAIDGNNLLRFELHQLRTDDNGTVSGRYSSSNKNIQQVMSVKKQIRRFGIEEFIIRDLFEAEMPEHYFYSSDARQIEYRLLAHYAKPPKVLAEYEKDPLISFHEVVWDMVKKMNPDLAYEPLKNLNFAKIYGAGLDKIAEMIGLPRVQSDEFNRIYDKEFPEAKALLNFASKVARKRGWVKTLLGRRTRFDEIYNRFHKAVNAIIQGSAGDIMKTKLVELHRERKTTLLKMRFTVHDEVCGDIPDEEHKKMVDEILNHQSFETLVPILWKSNIAKTWARCDYKLAA